MWTFIRFLHVVAVIVFVGGQLTLVVAVAPALRSPDGEAMRPIARRFGVAAALPWWS